MRKVVKHFTCFAEKSTISKVTVPVHRTGELSSRKRLYPFVIELLSSKNICSNIRLRKPNARLSLSFSLYFSLLYRGVEHSWKNYVLSLLSFQRGGLDSSSIPSINEFPLDNGLFINLGILLRD